jgi:hypothetical protein
MLRRLHGALFAAALALAACGAPIKTRERPSGIAPGPQGLPLGDGWVSDRPRVGHVWSCATRFPGGGGAHRAGEWIGEAFWDPARKPQVDGAVDWLVASADVTVRDEQRVITSNSLPDHSSGVYPIAESDDAYQYDRNPNTIAPQRVALTVPRVPVLAASPRCLPMGMVAVARNGVAIFHALDLDGRDAPAYEIQDACNGHPEITGQYHYHDHSACLRDAAPAAEHSELLGYAIDGFGLYGLRGEGGTTLVTNDLDDCHGHTHEIDWDGVPRSLYHYHMTPDYPYTLGCLRGR